MYSDLVIEHFSNPHNVGTMDDPDGYGKVGSPVCGDIMELYLRIAEGKIVDAKFRTFGCAAAIASSSIATDMIKGLTLQEAAELTDQKVVSALGGLPEAKIHCSVLAASALYAALEDYYAKHPDARPQEAGKEEPANKADS